MTSIEAVFRDRYGLHPRAAHRILQLAAGFEASLSIERLEGGGPIDARSMLGLVSSSIRAGESVRVTASGGSDEAEAEAAAALKRLLEAGVCHP